MDLNINPNTNGHLLVLPKEHYTNIIDLKDDVLLHSIKVIRETLYSKLKESLNCEGLTIAENNDLGQEILGFSDDLKSLEPHLKEFIKDNPAGQGQEKTPIILMHPES